MRMHWAPAGRRLEYALRSAAADCGACRMPAPPASVCMKVQHGQDRSIEAARATTPAVARPAEGVRGGGAPAFVHPRCRGAVSDAVGAVPPDADARRADRLRIVRAPAPRAAPDRCGTDPAGDRP